MNVPDISPAKNPNAVVGGGAGIGGGALVVYLLSLVGVGLDPYLGAVVAGVVTTGVLFVGKHGLRGIVRLVWRGNE